MKKLITGIVNILPNILGKVIPEGAKTKVAAVGAIVMGVGGYAMTLVGADGGIGPEAATALVLGGLAALGIYDKIDREV